MATGRVVPTRGPPRTVAVPKGASPSARQVIRPLRVFRVFRPNPAQPTAARRSDVRSMCMGTLKSLMPSCAACRCRCSSERSSTPRGGYSFARRYMACTTGTVTASATARGGRRRGWPPARRRTRMRWAMPLGDATTVSCLRVLEHAASESQSATRPRVRKQPLLSRPGCVSLKGEGGGK